MRRSLADELVERLRARRRVRVPVAEAMALFVELRPELAASTERVTAFVAVLNELTDREIIEPAKKRVTLNGMVVPAHLTIVALRRGPPTENPAVRFPWVDVMAWAATGRRRPAEDEARLQMLSRWIAANRERVRVPVRERSLEIFGEDKVLDGLVDRWLTRHPATIVALAVERIYPPMAIADVPGAIGGHALVIENGTTFWSVVRGARQHVASERNVRYRWIGFGVGEQLSAIIGSLHDQSPEGIDYFGDLDANGLAIAAKGARACEALGLPRLRPATALYAALLERGRPQPVEGGVRWPRAGLTWLGEGLANELDARLGGTSWLAQEWIGLEYLSMTSTWCAALT